MTSIRDREAGRDAEDYDNDRKEGRYAAGGDRADWYPVEPREMAPLSPETQAAYDAALVQIERFLHAVHHPKRTDWFAVAADIADGSHPALAGVDV